MHMCVGRNEGSAAAHEIRAHVVYVCVNTGVCLCGTRKVRPLSLYVCCACFQLAPKGLVSYLRSRHGSV